MEGGWLWRNLWHHGMDGTIVDRSCDWGRASVDWLTMDVTPWMVWLWLMERSRIDHVVNGWPMPIEQQWMLWHWWTLWMESQWMTIVWSRIPWHGWSYDWNRNLGFHGMYWAMVYGVFTNGMLNDGMTMDRLLLTMERFIILLDV